MNTASVRLDGWNDSGADEDGAAPGGRPRLRVEYSLTPLGRSLTGPLFALYEWADTQFDSLRAALRAYDAEDEPAPLHFTAAFRVRA